MEDFRIIDLYFRREPLYTVIIWARCADGEDVFVTYPHYPEFTGLKNRERYTLEKLRRTQTEAYGDCRITVPLR